jgi:hypothetical protein
MNAMIAFPSRCYATITASARPGRFDSPLVASPRSPRRALVRDLCQLFFEHLQLYRATTCQFCVSIIRIRRTTSGQYGRFYQVFVVGRSAAKNTSQPVCVNGRSWTRCCGASAKARAVLRHLQAQLDWTERERRLDDRRLGNAGHDASGPWGRSSRSLNWNAAFDQRGKVR